MSGVRAKLGVALILIGAAGVGAWLGTRSDSGDAITFLDVGQGACTVIQSGGRTALIDAGPAGRGGDAGEKIVVPRLRELGVTSIDVVILTHPDSDHIGGTGAVLRAYPGTPVAISDRFQRNREALDDFRRWNVADSQVRWLGRAQRMRLGAFTLDVLTPDNPLDGRTNDGSAFIHATSPHASVVVTGDAPIRVEASMLGRLDWRAELLAAGHHGSRTSCGESWIAAVQPKMAIISCGRDNEYGHPHRATLDRLNAAGVRALRTDELGELRFEVRSNRLTLVQGARRW